MCVAEQLMFLCLSRVRLGTMKDILKCMLITSLDGQERYCSSSAQYHKGVSTLIDFSSSIFSSVNILAGTIPRVTFIVYPARLNNPLSHCIVKYSANCFNLPDLSKEKIDEEKSINVDRPLRF